MFHRSEVLHGQLIRIASNSEQHVNPMDITIDDYLFSNPMEVSQTNPIF